MSTGDGGEDNRSFHLEGGIPVFNRQLDDIQREQAAANARDKAYKDEQLALNRRMVWFTLLLVFCTAVGIAINGWQAHISNISAQAAKSSAETAAKTLLEIQKSSTDTHELAVQAKNQAERTKEISETSRTQAFAAMKTAENAIANTENAQSAFRDEQRAWLGIATFRVVQFEPGKDYKVDVQIVNSGRSPAIHVEDSGSYFITEFFGEQPRPIPVLKKPFTSVPPQGAVLSHFTISAKEMEPWFDKIKNRSAFAFLTGRIEYDDIALRRHRTDFCLFLMDPETKELGYCDKGNNMN